jgi:hypothetical protein
MEGLGQLKNPMTSGIEPATFRLVRYRVPPLLEDVANIILMIPRTQVYSRKCSH